MNKTLTILAAVTTLSLAPAVTSAGTVLFGDGTNTTPALVDGPGSQTVSILDGKRDMTVTALTWVRDDATPYPDDPFNAEESGPASLDTDGFASTGLGVVSSDGKICILGCFPVDDDPRVDGVDDNDVVLFEFDRPVLLTKVGFDGILELFGGERFVFVQPDKDPNAETLEMADLPFIFGDAGYDWGDGIELTSFAIGAEKFDQAFRIRELHLEAVPLPAGVWLMLGGLGLLGFARRRA